MGKIIPDMGNYLSENPLCSGLFGKTRQAVLAFLYLRSDSSFYTTFGVADVLRQSLVPLADKVQVSFIFGSVARSADDRRSDIDLMVIGRITFGEVVSLLKPAEEMVGREINPVVYPVAEFKKKVKSDHHFVRTVVEEAKIFVIGDEDELRKLAER